MEQEHISSTIFILGTGAATVLCWALLGTLSRLYGKQKSQKIQDTSLGLLDRDARIHRQTHNADLAVHIALLQLIATPLLFGASYGVFVFMDALKQDEATVWFVAVGALLCGYAFFRYRTALLQRREIHWHNDAKAIVDRAIAPLVPRGYVVFRDFKAENMTIDHLLIGPKGIFTLQTLVRPTNHKEVQEVQSAVAKVTYDGRALFFPQGEEHLMIEQAEKHAEEISEWVSKRIGIPIAARGIVTLPGWQVKRVSAQGISVINPGQLEALFQYIKPWPLSEDILLQIVRLIENHYENIRGVHIETVTGEGLPS